MPPVEARSMKEQLEDAWKKGSEEPSEEEEEVVTEEEVEDGTDAEAGGSEKDAKKPTGDSEEEEAELKAGSEKPDKGEKRGTKEEPGDKKSAKAEPTGDRDKGGDRKAADEELKAPVSWKPATREHWGKIPKEAQAEIVRRETEINNRLQQAAGFRKVASEYLSVVKPFEQLIRAQNSTPSQAITNLMTTAARLMQGTKQQKAEVVAEILANYDVDIPTLDSILTGKVKPGDDQDAKITNFLKEELKPIREFIDGVKGSQQENVRKGQEEVNQSFESFRADPKNEFLEDVREDMADLIELASNRGRVMTLADAYEKACNLHPEVSKIIAQRKARVSGELTGDKLLKKKRAASSIKGNPDEDSGGKKDSTDIRGAISQAFEDLEQR